jgi:UDP-glucose:(heptosyl)LPS alpha-1,3-glucosyltransferase
MLHDKVTIGFVRRGYSVSGGAEAYLKRLAQGIVNAGHEVHLFTTTEWPTAEWPFGPLIQLRSESPIGFADEMERARHKGDFDVVLSLERIWRCNIYRTGDGVHRAWLRRRADSRPLLGKLVSQFTRKHSDILRLEESLLRDRGAARVIANSKMVKRQIVKFYDYPAEKIDLVYNGVPIAAFARSAEKRSERRAALRLKPEDMALLFVGSGWERKGLHLAIEAIRRCDNPRLRLFVAGRGPERKFQGRDICFLGVLRDLSAVYAAADIFILPTLYDAFSNACLEALASGLPVITTDANGFGEIIVDDVHGSVLDSPAEIEAIVRAIRFWSDADRRTQARPLILEQAAQFDISKNVDRTLEILLQEASASAASASGKIRNT